jgi:uncharacterized membrane protein YfcA
MSADLLALAASGAVTGLAAFAQATTGFGFALVAIPLLATVTGPEQAIVAVTALSGLLSGGAAWRYQRAVVVAEVVRYTWTGLIGMPFGLLLLLAVPESTLTAVVGAVVLAAVLAMATRCRARSARLQLGVGVTAGALLTSTGMNGPLIVIGLDGQKRDPSRFRATSQAIFFVQDIFALTMFLAAGLVDAAELLAVGGIALPAGWTLGSRVFLRLNPAQFRAGMLCMLTLSAGVALISGLSH